MAIGWELVGRVGVLAVLVLLTIGANAGLVGPEGFARWPAAVLGSDVSGRVRMTSNRVAGLYPGSSEALVLTLRNTSSRRGITLSRIRVRDVASTNEGCSPSPRNLAIQQYSRKLRLAAGATRQLLVRVAMPNTVASACQNAVFQLYYTAAMKTGTTSP